MVIDAESESEEEPRAEQILHGNFEHAPPICRLLWRLVADQPEQTASREKYEKHPEQELDEHGGKTNQLEESERRRNNGQNKKRPRPSKHGKPRIFLASSPPETCIGSLSSGARALPTEVMFGRGGSPEEAEPRFYERAARPSAASDESRIGEIV